MSTPAIPVCREQRQEFKFARWGYTSLILALQRQIDFPVQDQPSLQSDFQDSQSYTKKLYLEKNKTSQAVVAHAFSPSTWEAEAGGSL